MKPEPWNCCKHHFIAILFLSACLGAEFANGAPTDAELRAQGISKSIPLPKFPNREMNITAFGAVGDGVTLNTDAFAKAIAALSEKGGGKLIVPPGIWLTGPIKLSSNVNLHLERGSLIQFSGDYKLYPLTLIDMKGEKEVDSVSPISGENLQNVAITGDGIIDGGGEAWRAIKKDKLSDGEWKALIKSGGVVNKKGDTWYPSQQVMEGAKIVERMRTNNVLSIAEYEPYHQYLRPKMLRLIGCKNVLLQGVTFQNPPNWTLNPALCENVSILNVEVRNSPDAQNSDALDLESCRHAVIRDCIFDAGDDGICIKSGKDAAGRRIGVPTEDVLVADCTVYHAHGGFTIGSEMSGGVRNMRVDNCTFIGTDTGLRFKSTRGRGGVVEKIYISNVRMKDIVGDAINFNLYYGGRSVLEETNKTAETAETNKVVEAGDTADAAQTASTNVPPVTAETPQFRDIHIENIICRGAQGAIVLQGLPEMPLRDITLKNVSITSKKGVSVTDAENVLFENVQVKNKTGDALKTVRVKNSKLDLLND